MQRRARHYVKPRGVVREILDIVAQYGQAIQLGGQGAFPEFKPPETLWA